MTKKKFYFAENREDEGCYSLDLWKEMMVDEEIDQLSLYGAEPEKVPGYFWCKKDHEVYEKNLGNCGFDWCNNYTPRNGKSGICKHNTNTFNTPTDTLIILKRIGDKFKIERS